MSGKAPSWSFFPKQWLGDDKVLLMDWDARGMHLHLMCVCWQQEPQCSLPDDMVSIRKWLGNPNDKDWARVRPQIFAAWELRDGRWWQRGMERALQKQKNYAASNSKNADTRWEKVRRLHE